MSYRFTLKVNALVIAAILDVRVKLRQKLHFQEQVILLIHQLRDMDNVHLGASDNRAGFRSIGHWKADQLVHVNASGMFLIEIVDTPCYSG